MNLTLSAAALFVLVLISASAFWPGDIASEIAVCGYQKVVYALVALLKLLSKLRYFVLKTPYELLIAFYRFRIWLHTHKLTRWIFDVKR